MKVLCHSSSHELCHTVPIVPCTGTQSRRETWCTALSASPAALLACRQVRGVDHCRLHEPEIAPPPMPQGPFMRLYVSAGALQLRHASGSLSTAHMVNSDVSTIKCPIALAEQSRRIRGGHGHKEGERDSHAQSSAGLWAQRLK